MKKFHDYFLEMFVVVMNTNGDKEVLHFTTNSNDISDEFYTKFLKSKVNKKYTLLYAIIDEFKHFEDDTHEFLANNEISLDGRNYGEFDEEMNLIDNYAKTYYTAKKSLGMIDEAR